MEEQEWGRAEPGDCTARYTTAPEATRTNQEVLERKSSKMGFLLFSFICLFCFVFTEC